MKESINTNQYWKIEVLTPVHVGVGIERAWKSGIDIFQRNNSVILINKDKLFEILYQRGRLEEYCSYLAKGNFDNCKREVEGLDINTINAISLQTFNFPYTDISVDGIRPLIRNGVTGKPYLPGSSVKGAIRSILFKYVRKSISRLANAKDDEVFGRIDNNIMRLFRFSDAPMSNSSLMRMKIFNLMKKNKEWHGGWKHSRRNTTENFKKSGFHNDLEVFPINAEGFMRFGIANEVSGNIWEKMLRGLPEAKEVLLKNANFNLFSIINNHTKRYLEKQIKFFENYSQAEHTEKIIQKLEKLKNSIPSNNSYCILKLGGGSGFHSITGDWQYEEGFTEKEVGLDGNKKVKYKSRKICFEKVNGNLEFYLMGFIKITSISLDEWKKNIEKSLKSQEIETKVNTSETFSVSEETKLSDSESKRPQYYNKRLKQGGEIEGIILEVGNPNKVKVLVREGYEPIMDVRYGSGFEKDKIGAVVVLKIGNVRGEGDNAQLLSVSFVKFK
ncbi:MAG: type III-A CRISPR-associated RAMP protein Csm5 [Cytophagales bacterium]|nr:type III-A CRISPR-associated RAMP protein Csm5 [Bernardetiaceae bacterium]MDW8211053.1 type III-A CRISPR-associated RAMP protein Csm5 [Cytophagales bacterium]